jgi:hypothetical protein
VNKRERPDLFGAPKLCATTNGFICVTHTIPRECFGIRSHELIACCL